MTRAKIVSSVPKLGVTTRPPVPKFGSSAPFDRYRASAKSLKVVWGALLVPAATSLPSGWTARAWIPAPRPSNSVVTRPPFPKLGSSAPFGKRRATLKAETSGLKATSPVPPATSLPSGWTARAPNCWTVSPNSRDSRSTLPPVPKAGSRSPAAARAGRAPWLSSPAGSASARASSSRTRPGRARWIGGGDRRGAGPRRSRTAAERKWGIVRICVPMRHLRRMLAASPRARCARCGPAYARRFGPSRDVQPGLCGGHAAVLSCSAVETRRRSPIRQLAEHRRGRAGHDGRPVARPTHPRAAGA